MEPTNLGQAKSAKYSAEVSIAESKLFDNLA